MPTSRLTAALLAGSLIGLTVVGASAAGKKQKEEQPPSGPAARLSVSPRHGFRPLTLTLSGALIGVEPGDPEYCHAGIEWEARSAQGLITTSKEDPRCLHPPEQVSVQLGFTKVVTLDQPGTYVYRLIVHRRDGTRLLSNTQEVKVIGNQ
ncbi:MAG TPA: hypothetical protein VJV23_01595 [Candidatus Polarisedimenticolia bacterium]|nr:hypothetical protein [Candidatus Polarisedimenticolia bacterium]